MRGLDYTRALPRDRRTILKDNISWHLPYLSANSTPWQLEGVVRTLREDGYRDLLGLHNQTVVTDAHRGDKLNKFAGVYRRYEVPTRRQLLARLPLGDDRAEGEAARPRPDLRRGAGARGDDRQQRRAPADGEDPRLHHDDRRDEERLRRPPAREPPLGAHRHPRDARGPPGDPEGDPPGDVRGDGRHDLRRRGRAARDDPGGQGLRCWRATTWWRSTP